MHIFQGKDLPAADSNGLCDPYLKVSFMGQVQKTHHKKKTVYPCYYQTLTYQNIALPDAEDFAYAPMLCLRLYDRDDYDEDDYLGTCFFHLKDAFITEEVASDANKEQSPSEPTIESVLQKDPTWLKFFYEVPGDSQGEVLVAVQLIPTLGKTIPKPPKDEFTVQSRDAFIEFLVVGMRDMAPYMMQPIQNPFVNIELNSCGTRFATDTKKSKEPEPMNPNFLQRIVMPVKLPVNSLFTTPLLLKVSKVVAI
ncbi:hypothetical protein EON65_10350 [archaeon]|nr:MAG: hypothetical protein EON65_10350 [archaeon]